MFVVLIVACAYGTPDCRALEIANELPDMKVCVQLASQLVLNGWSAKNPKDYILNWTCTDSPNYYLYRFDA